MSGSRSAGSRFRSIRAVGAGLLAIAIALATLIASPPSAQADSLPAGAIKVTILDMSPTTPPYTGPLSKLTFSLQIQNTTDQTIGRAELDVNRDSPITSPSALATLIAAPVSGDDSLAEELTPVQLPALAPHEIYPLTYTTATTSTVTNQDICLCNPGVYPIDFTVRAASDPNGSTTDAGFAQTYLPSFPIKPAPVEVSWVWPLIDRPHRVTGQNVFVDDDLTASISKGGRLDRALSVAEQVAPYAHLSLVIDPELIDELTVMAAGYFVRAGTAPQVAGTGGPTAAAFLKRLEDLAPLVDISLTSYADPDTDALAAQGLTWTDPRDATDASIQTLSVLGADTHSDFAWPVNGSTTSSALDQVVDAGASTVLLNDSMFSATSGQLDAIAPLPAGTGTTAIVTNSTLQGLVSRIVSTGGTGTQQLPILVSDLAVRTFVEPAGKHYVALAAPRYVDANVGAAVRAIKDTTTATWAAGLSVHEAASALTPVSHGSLTPAGSETSPGLSPTLLDALSSTTHFLKTFNTALASPGDAVKLEGDLPFTVAWAESNAWRQNQSGAVAYTTYLDTTVEAFQAGVHIARPSNGSYTLASSSAPLFVTVINSLPFAMKVNVTLVPVNGAVGFQADLVTGMTVAAHSQTPLKVGVHVQRAGRFQILASVTTADGTDLGQPVSLSVRSTALGAVGVTITAVAGGLLVLLLLLRLVRRIRRGPTPPRRGVPFSAATSGTIST